MVGLPQSASPWPISIYLCICLFAFAAPPAEKRGVFRVSDETYRYTRGLPLSGCALHWNTNQGKPGKEQRLALPIHSTQLSRCHAVLLLKPLIKPQTAFHGNEAIGDLLDNTQLLKMVIFPSTIADCGLVTLRGVTISSSRCDRALLTGPSPGQCKEIVGVNTH